MKNLAPILLFVFNRYEHTVKTIDALKANHLARDSDLFIYCDGIRNSKDIQEVEKVRNYVMSIDGFKSISVNSQAENIGLANSIIEGVTKVVNDNGKVIVLEDDMITSPYFLSYMNDALNLYENNEDVCSIHSYVYPLTKKIHNKCFFLKGADCWGWATWKKSWQLFDPDGEKLLHEIESHPLKHEFDFNGYGGYIEMLKSQVEGRIDSWAIRWYASAFLANKLTLYPTKTYVVNIGIDGSGTHCSTDSRAFLSELSYDYSPLTRQLVAEDPLARIAFNSYFKRLNSLNIVARIKKKFRLGKFV